MSEYTPDRWQVVKIAHDKASHYRVFASWYGGWAGSDSWKLNSGITKVTFDGDFYHFEGSSGSVYVCHKDSYGANLYGQSVLMDMMKNAAQQGTFIEILPEETPFLELNYD
jgi:hypothetical protein